MSNETTITVPLVHAHIDRHRDTITALVPKHEIRVLKAVHGMDKVREGDPSDETITLPASADAEMLRLQSKYRRVNSPDAALTAYPTGAEGLERHGFELGRGSGEAIPQAGIRKHRKPAPLQGKPAAMAKGKPADSGEK